MQIPRLIVHEYLQRLGVPRAAYTGGTLAARSPITGEVLAQVPQQSAADAKAAFAPEAPWLATLAQAGDHVILASALYGGSHNLVVHVLQGRGIASTVVARGGVPLVVVPIILYGRRVRRLARESQDRVAELGKNKSRPVVLVCASGARSAKGVEVLRKAGFEQVFNLDGGVKGWKDAGQPVVSGKKA